MKLKHNKKRNTAFLFEALSRELTKSIIGKNGNEKKKILSIIKEHFMKGREIAKELELYKSITGSENLDSYSSEKIIYEVRKQYEKLDKKKIFEEQSSLIKKINKTLSKDIFSNFVPNYKNLATIYQIFNSDISPKNKVLLENEIVGYMSSKDNLREQKAQIPSDKLVLNSFIKKFNETYSTTLREEQQELLNKYVTSFVDNGIELKIFLNEEIGRIKKVLKKSSRTEQNPEVNNKTNKVLEVIDNFKDKNIDSNVVEKILKIQNLVSEITK